MTQGWMYDASSEKQTHYPVLTDLAAQVWLTLNHALLRLEAERTNSKNEVFQKGMAWKMRENCFKWEK